MYRRILSEKYEPLPAGYRGVARQYKVWVSDSMVSRTLRRLAHLFATNSSDEKSLHCSLVPLDTYTWPIRDADLPFLYPDGLLKNGTCVVEVL